MIDFWIWNRIFTIQDRDLQLSIVVDLRDFPWLWTLFFRVYRIQIHMPSKISADLNLDTGNCYRSGPKKNWIRICFQVLVPSIYRVPVPTLLLFLPTISHGTIGFKTIFIGSQSYQSGPFESGSILTGCFEIQLINAFRVLI